MSEENPRRCPFYYFYLISNSYFLKAPYSDPEQVFFFVHFLQFLLKTKVDPFQSFSPLFFQPLTVNQCGPYNPSLPTQTELLSLLSSGPMTTILKMSNITDLFFNIKAIRFPETLGSAHKATHCHIPEEYKHKRSGVIILLRK